MDSSLKKQALHYHATGRPGKIEVVPTKPYSSQRDLSLAYSPGVAEPCLQIKEDKEKAYDYTAKSNLVAVISNGTAVLGLGDIGAQASKPVMEGKGFLFKIFADIDVFDIEVDEKDVDKFVETVMNIAPTFGGINLEDIKAPQCFDVEKQLKAKLDIPVMHDDQHGTAIITSAGLLNALSINGKKLSEVKVVVNGAGASAISCSRLYTSMGVKKENLVMLDSKGVIRHDRENLPAYKKDFATQRNLHKLDEAIEGADVFLGLSKGGILKPAMVEKMAPDPVIFALANPEPEITYEEATATRTDIIMGTGRSDYPNQVNNVLGFPYIFRGALDVRATDINEEMKIAAAKALADLAKEPVPQAVNETYDTANLHFGKDYIIPKPTDPRLICTVAAAVAKAAVDSGVARKPITDWESYQDALCRRMGLGNRLTRQIKAGARRRKRKIVLTEGASYKILKAVEIVVNEDLAEPILMGNKQAIHHTIDTYELEVPKSLEIIDPKSKEEQARLHEFAEIFYQKRQRRGITKDAALELMQHRNYFSSMLIETGYADGMVSGETDNYPSTIRPALQTIGVDPMQKRVSGMYIINTKQGPYFFADCTVNKKPDEDALYEITLQTAEMVTKLNVEPRVALVSYSNFGSSSGRTPDVMRNTTKRLHKEHPQLIVDGELQANVALNGELLREKFPFSKLGGKPANTLIFPYLSAANIAYKVMQELSPHQIIGPILMGMAKPVHIIPMGCKVDEIVNMIAFAANDANKT